MHYLYVLYSLKDHRLYKGTCSDLPARFLRHNTGGNKSTAHRRPLVLIHVESFETKKEALAREREVKTLEGGPALEQTRTGYGVSISKQTKCVRPEGNTLGYTSPWALKAGRTCW